MQSLLSKTHHLMYAGSSRPLLNFVSRGIKLHEYQAGKLLHSFRVPIPLGNVAFDSREAYLVSK